MANLGRLTNNDSCAVVNEETASNARPGMDLDTGEEAVEMGYKTRHGQMVSPPEPMGQPV